MKIVILGARLPPANDGVGDHAHMLALALRLRGDDVTIISAGQAAETAPYNLRLAGSSWSFGATVRALAFLRALRPEALLVEYTPFLYGARSFAPLAVLFAASALRIRSLIIVHEAFYTSSMPAVRNVWKAAFFGLRDAATIRCANVVAIASIGKAKTLIQRLPTLEKRMVIVPIGANIEPESAYWRCASERATVVSFGVVMPRRRLELAIVAIARLVAVGRDVRLKIIGRTHDREYAERLSKLALEEGVADRVAFCGELAPAALSEALSKASAAVHAATEGSVPSSGSLLALLSHGVPTVAIRTDFDDLVFGDSIDFVEDEGALARALDVLISHPPTALRLSAAARVCYETNFSWFTAADRVSRAVAAA